MVIRWISLAFCLILCQPAAAWGKQGRQLVTGIARGLLEPQVQQVIDHYLGTPAWDEASDWLETSTTEHNAALRGQWRKALVPKDQTYVPTKSPNLVNQIEYQLMVLERRALFQEKDIARAIRTLFCLITDVHQPLRCGYTEDEGGATLQVTAGGKTTSLFKLWDEQLLLFRPVTMWDCSDILMRIPEGERKRLQNSGPAEWAQESRALLPGAYALPGGVATEAYLGKGSETAKMQLVRAGMRLAAVLNKYFKD